MQFRLMQKPFTKTMVLMLIIGMLAAPAAGLPGCGFSCCVHDTHGTQKGVSFTAPPAHACCCSPSTDNPPCNVMESSPTPADHFLPASNGGETPSQQELKSVAGHISPADPTAGRTATSLNPRLNLPTAKLYLQHQSFLS